SGIAQCRQDSRPQQVRRSGVLTGEDGGWYNWAGFSHGKAVPAMHNEFTAVIEQDGAWFVAFCPEVPGTNGQRTTRDEALSSLKEAIKLILEDSAQPRSGGSR